MDVRIPIHLPERHTAMPVVPLFAVQGADGRWLVYFDEERDVVTMLLFTSEEMASRYINASPDLLDSPGYSLVLFCRTRPQLLQMAQCARRGGVGRFQVDRMPCGDCWYEVDLDRLLTGD